MIKIFILVSNKNNKEKAFISIFAIFFSAIVTSVLLALFVLLVKQIQLLNIESNSFQSLYTVDSIYECVLFLEKRNNETSYANKLYAYNTTLFRPNNFGNLTGCAFSGDVIRVSSAEVGNRATSIFKYPLNISPDNKFCGIATIVRNTDDASSTNILSILGRSSDCDTNSGKVIERGLDFIY